VGVVSADTAISYKDDNANMPFCWFVVQCSVYVFVVRTIFYP